MRPSLTAPEPVAARCHGEALTLEVSLLGSPTWWPLTLDERIRVGSSVAWLKDLKPQSFELSGPRAVTSLTYRRRTPPLHLLLLLDYSEAAAALDPSDQRRLMARQLVDSLNSMCVNHLGCVTQVSLLVLRGAGVQVLAAHETSLDRVKQLLLDDPNLTAQGRAPLWDGLVQVGRLLHGDTGEMTEVVVLYWGSAGDSDSTATQDQGMAVAATVPVLVVRGPGAGESLVRDVAASSHGMLLQPTLSDVAGLYGVLASVVAGVWELAIAGGCGSEDVVAGTLDLTLPPQASWTRSFRLPLL